MNGDKMKQFMIGIGAISQIAGMLYRDLISQGFSKEQALDIAKGFVVEMLTKGKKEPNEQSH